MAPWTKAFTTARELMEYLSPHNETEWGKEPRDWLFRGQRDASWGLMPSVWRKPKPTLPEQEAHERWLFRQFCSFADAQSLPLPNYSPAFWDSGAEPWNQDLYRPALALAQHHEVPTRLLDWSRRPYVAAYFAANRGVVDAGITHLAVWVIRRREHGKELLGGSQMRLVFAPRAGNSNLHLQSGIFSLTGEGARSPTDLRPHDAVYRDLFPAASHAKWLQKLTLPSSEARELLRLLHQVFVHGAAIYGGYEGAKHATFERKLIEGL